MNALDAVSSNYQRGILWLIVVDVMVKVTSDAIRIIMVVYALSVKVPERVINPFLTSIT